MHGRECSLRSQILGKFKDLWSSLQVGAEHSAGLGVCHGRNFLKTVVLTAEESRKREGSAVSFRECSYSRFSARLMYCQVGNYENYDGPCLNEPRDFEHCSAALYFCAMERG